ncbi:MAG: translation initiation factor IF-3 [bacterium]|nr:translation initiation factor IF-3 [bacterium]
MLVDAEGTKRGVIPIQEALAEAEEAGLDLVEVAATAVPPVCKIMDYGKMAYQAKKKKTHVKSSSEMKEISFSMKISEHDIDTKLKKAREFVEKGHKLRFNLILRGRERAYAETNGLTQLRRLVTKMADITTVEQMSQHMLGNRLFAILAPAKVKKPATAKSGSSGGDGVAKAKPSENGQGSGGIVIPDDVRAVVSETTPPEPVVDQTESPTPS